MKQPNKNKRKPIIVSDKNDSRYKAYQDSLKMYNIANQEVNRLRKEDEDDMYHIINGRPSLKSGVRGDNPLGEYWEGHGGTKLKPIGTLIDTYRDNVPVLPIFKYPTQPVIIKNSTIKTNNNKKYKSTITDKADLLNTKLSNGNVPRYADDTPVYTRKPNTTTGKQVKEQGTKGMVFNETIKRKPIVPVQNLNSKEIETSNTINPVDIKIPISTKTPKSYKIEETTPNKFGGYTSNYEVSNIDNISNNKMSGNNTRKITPVYQNGGQLNINNNNMKKKKQLIPKGMIGLDMGIGLGMSAISAVTSIIQANKVKKEEAKARNLAAQNNFTQATTEQDIYNAQFKEDNLNDLPVYAKGGNINNTNNLSTTGKFDTVGGALVPVSNNAEVVVGNKHSEKKVDGSYGVTLSKDGQPIANVEEDEVVVNNRLVFSDKLKKGTETFADIALKVNTKIGELQENLKTTKKPSEKFSIERTITGLENQNSNLFKEQELVKQNTYGDTDEVVAVEDGVVPTAAKGADLNKYAPLIPLAADNITNLILTSKAPKPASPITRRAPILDTTVNVNPALAEIKNSINAGNKIIGDSTNNSAVSRANKTANNLRGLQASSNMLATKDAQEVQLKNNQNSIVANVANANAGLNEQYLADVYQNQLEQNASTSANISNFVEDFTAVQKDINTGNKEESILELDALNDPTGQTKRDLANSALIMKKNKQAILEQKKEARKRAIERDLKY